VRVASSSPNESTLVEDTLGGLPKRLIADRAYDSDRVDERLRQEHSLELIVPNRGRRKRTQDGRPLRRYAGVGKWSGCYAWLKNYRRICSRWERQAANFLGMVPLGCPLIPL
jgi:transposase